VSQRSSGSLEGPRPARSEEIEDIVALANLVFRPEGRGGEMGGEFPVLFDPANAENLYIVRDGRRVASHVGVLRQTICTCGLRIPVACIGSVCTHPDYRGRGLASQLMDLAIRRSVEAGDLLMPISGGRGLYRRLGAVSLGPYVRFAVPTETGRAMSRKFAVRRYEPADWPQLTQLQQAEMPRWQWDDSQTPRLLGAFLEFGGTCLVAEDDAGQFAGALVFVSGSPLFRGQPGRGNVVQFLGRTETIPALLAATAEQGSLSGLDWPVLLPAQPAVATALRSLGATGQGRLTGWTVRILDLAKLVERLAPVAASCGLELTVKGPRLVVAAEDEAASFAQPDEQIGLLFRGAATWARQLAELPAALRLACSVALPVPLPDYGINYV